MRSADKQYISVSPETSNTFPSHQHPCGKDLSVDPFHRRTKVVQISPYKLLPDFYPDPVLQYSRPFIKSHYGLDSVQRHGVCLCGISRPEFVKQGRSFFSTTMQLNNGDSQGMLSIPRKSLPYISELNKGLATVKEIRAYNGVLGAIAYAVGGYKNPEV